MNRSAVWRRRPPVAASTPAISSSASCGGRIRFRVRPAPPASGTCAATGATPNAASRSATATAPSSSASSPISWSRSIRARHRWRAAGADEHRRQGVGSHRAHRSARALLAAADAAGHRRRPDRPLAAMMGAQRGLDVHVLDHEAIEQKPDLVRCSSAPPITPAASRSSTAVQARHPDGMHRRAERRARRSRPHRAGRHRLPRRRHCARP